MPHSTTSGSTIQTSSVNRSQYSPRSHSDTDNLSANGGMEKFPDHIDSYLTNGSRATSPAKTNGYALPGATTSGDRWQPRKESLQGRGVRWGGAAGQLPATRHGHGRQKSLGDAIHNIRTRGGSVGQNAHEIADALRAPVSPKLIALCVLWYTSSALTNTSSKSILTAFDKPATLTLIQFAFVATYCILFAWLANIFPSLRTTIPALKHGIRYPSRDVITTTLPLAAFQIFGHLLSSTATSKIPVSLVHTIKGLSPLFTVLAYRLVFNIRYSINTYLSLVPLTLGVMLACSGKHNKYSGELLGILYALLATIIFVTQNIFSKRLFNEAAKAEAEGQSARSQKLDKLNLLCYSSGMAFILTVPIWFWSEGTGIIGDVLHDGAVDLNEKAGSFDHGRLTIEFIFNGTFHFGQNILAFVLLSLVSPVTYSVASLIKRVFVIVIAIIWFRNQTTPLQGVGILLTFVGLYLYDRTHDRDKADRKAKMMEIKEEPLLPLNTKEAFSASQNAPVFESPMVSAGPFQSFSNGPSPRRSEDSKKSDGPSNGRARGASNAAWLAPGTKQEDTWRFGDR
ncbi:Triose-phosphate transporter [Colletotrichum higginsianum IMI 349063]|uniref:Triose-phosphate transporter n=3 Tax=Colletotrichum destructivum species complex TaxID=2707350 RepID=A0A1B7XUY7_COLHI|nr:Triose-phosphate transporter [Colletotrichum higginsianum IMI 349063]OBR03566.1 Triose-phosphate transporter [Colletotrichum higginsianum IMI 349063]TIC97556.1 putative transporter C83.11 [Colletotrichum higginsianum]GJD02089.1 triose-phosphate transporter [Colletotrichum higginsianum]